MPPKVEIFTAEWCPHCRYPKELFKKKGIAYEEIDIGDDHTRSALVKRTGGERSVPQIFINGEHIGDEEELARLEKSGVLDTLLAEPPTS
jgi:glutaredoxin 3